PDNGAPTPPGSGEGPTAKPGSVRRPASALPVPGPRLIRTADVPPPGLPPFPARPPKSAPGSAPGSEPHNLNSRRTASADGPTPWPTPQDLLPGPPATTQNVPPASPMRSPPGPVRPDGFRLPAAHTPGSKSPARRPHALVAV